MILTGKERDFARRHLDADLAGLVLSAHQYPDIAVRNVVPCIAALRKLRIKVPLWFRFDLDIPPALSVEQASSEIAARFKASLFSGQRMLDLTGGVGVDAFFWSASFEEVFYVERDPELAESARHNFALLGAKNIRVLTAEAESFLHFGTDTFDLIYLDPARRDENRQRMFRLEECSPNVLTLRERLLQRAPRVLIKAAPLLDLSLAMEQLQYVTRIWVVSVAGEVKEVLLLLERTRIAPDEVPIEAVAISHRGERRRFVYSRAEERTNEPTFASPKAYLYEPDAAVLKAGAFKTFAVRYGLEKLSPHAHLYTSASYISGMPARAFAIEAVEKYDKRAVQRYLPEKRANVIVRHFPDTAEQTRKRLGLSEGGDRYLFGTTTFDGQKILILCRYTVGLAETLK